MRVLIADDEPQSRRMLEIILSRFGHQVTSVANGRAACDALTGKDAPEMAVLDWMMPGMDGVDVCRAIRARKNEPYIYIVLVTCKTGQSDVVKGLDAGADDYIAKPYNINELEARFRAGERVLALQRGWNNSRDQLTQQATQDALTGVLNRAALMPILEADLAKAARDTKPLSVVMIDLDKFKAINDTHGHQAGDAVLSEAAERMKAALHESDILGRYGGEEFLAILPNCDSDKALIAAERIRAAVAKNPIATSAAQIVATCSIGVATFAPTSTPDPVALVGAADTALLQAKSSGRDRVVLASAAPAAAPVHNFAPPPLPADRIRRTAGQT